MIDLLGRQLQAKSRSFTIDPQRDLLASIRLSTDSDISMRTRKRNSEAGSPLTETYMPS
jgi:hypothetical protein